jgi:nicotinic acetylcholine receptor beta-2
MFSLLISGIIPASSTGLPTIVMYFITVMCMCSMSVVATVVVLALHHKTAKNHTMPMWVRELRMRDQIRRENKPLA